MQHMEGRTGKSRRSSSVWKNDNAAAKRKGGEMQHPSVFHTGFLLQLYRRHNNVFFLFSFAVEISRINFSDSWCAMNSTVIFFLSYFKHLSISTRSLLPVEFTEEAAVSVPSEITA